MKRWTNILAAAALALALGALPAAAAGVGGYAQLSMGSLDWTFDDDGPGDFDDDAQTLGGGLGVVFDTNLAKNELFNYRLSAGVEFLDADFDDVDSLDLTGLVVDNTLGFGVVRDKQMRVWIGPEIRLGYFRGDGGDLDDVEMLEIGIGPTAGINLHFGRLWDVSLSLGARLSFWRGDDEDADVDIDGNGVAVVFRMSLLRRGLDDTFLP